MSVNLAIKQREDSIAEYKRLLQTETYPPRIADIEERIKLCQEEINLIKNNKPLFGKARPLTQETRIYEPNPEKKGEQKVTIINPKPTEMEDKNPTPSENKIGNSLRSTLQDKAAESNKSSLRSRIMAAKAKSKTSSV